MLIQEKYDRMDWVSYGNARENAGKIEGMKEGKIEGGIESAIRIYRDEMKLEPSEITRKIMEHFHLEKEEANKYVVQTLGLQLV